VLSIYIYPLYIMLFFFGARPLFRSILVSMGPRGWSGTSRGPRSSSEFWSAAAERIFPMIMQPVLATVAPVDIPLPDAGFTVWGGGLFAFLLSPKKSPARKCPILLLDFSLGTVEMRPPPPPQTIGAPGKA
jgi:hypothetical protein